MLTVVPDNCPVGRSRWLVVWADGIHVKIHPDHQGGIGTRLISALMDEAGRKGQDLVLDTLTVDRRAQAFYQQLGMAEVARHGDNEHQDHHAVRPSGIAPHGLGVARS